MSTDDLRWRHLRATFHRAVPRFHSRLRSTWVRRAAAFTAAAEQLTASPRPSPSSDPTSRQTARDKHLVSVIETCQSLRIAAHRTGHRSSLSCANTGIAPAMRTSSAVSLDAFSAVGLDALRPSPKNPPIPMTRTSGLARRDHSSGRPRGIPPETRESMRSVSGRQPSIHPTEAPAAASPSVRPRRSRCQTTPPW